MIGSGFSTFLLCARSLLGGCKRRTLRAFQDWLIETCAGELGSRRGGPPDAWEQAARALPPARRALPLLVCAG